MIKKMDEKARRRFEQMYQEYEGTVRRLAYGLFL